MRTWLLAGALAAAIAGAIAIGACAAKDPAAPPPTTHTAEPGDAIDRNLMVALAEAKNYHHKAKLYTSQHDLPAAIASVRQILSLKFPPNAPEADDVRNDARALLAKLLIDQGQLDEAMRTVDEGLAASSRDSFFVANLYTVQGEIHEARAAALAADDPHVIDERHAAIAAYDKSIQIDEALQLKLMEER